MSVEVEYEPPADVATSSVGMGMSGFSIWHWVERDCLWVKRKEHCAPGYQPGTGPTEPGRYDGQIVRWMCVPITD